MTDLLEYIKKMQEMYGDDVITTADKINRPDPKPIVKDIEAINEFVKRNPRADGGRIGFAQGTPQRLSLINNLKSAIAEAKKTKNYGLLKAARRETGGVLSEQTAKFLNIAANDKDYAKSFAKELGISTKEFNSLLDKRATAIQEYGRSASQKSSLKRVDPNKRKMINLINEGVNDTSLLAKKLKISKTKVSEIGNALYKDIYATSSAIGEGATRTTGTGVATFLPDNAKDLNLLLKKLHNVKGLETVEQRQIKKILGEAFGGGKNPELFKLYNNKINEYYDLKKKLTGKINLNLDHPLSSQMIKKLKLGKEAQLFVQPLTAEINQGVKSLLDKTYAQAFASKGPGREAKMKAVLNLAKKIDLPMGSTKLISEPFYKQNLPKKIIEAAETQNKLIKNIKNLPKEEIAKVFKDKRTKLISPDVKQINVKAIVKKLNQAGFYCNKTNGGVCSNPKAYTKSIMENMELAKQGDNAAVAKINKMGKLMKGFKGAAKFSGWALLVEIGFAAPLAAVDYAKGANEDEIISNITYGLAGKSMKEQLKEIDPRYGQAQKLFDLYDKAQKAEELTREQGGYRSLYTNLQREEDAYKAAEKAMDPFMMPTPHLEEGRYFDENKVFTDLARDESRLADYMKEKEKTGLERMEKMQPVQFYTGAKYGGLIGDKSGPAPTGGPMSQGLRSLYNNGRKL